MSHKRDGTPTKWDISALLGEAAPYTRAKVSGRLWGGNMRVRNLLIVGATMIVASPASAADYLVTFSGTIWAGMDQAGIFGAARSSLAGKAFTADYVLTTPIQAAVQTWEPGSIGISGSGDNSPIRGSLSIAGKKYDFGTYLGYVGLSNAHQGYTDQIQYSIYTSFTTYMDTTVASSVRDFVPNLDPATPLAYDVQGGDTNLGYFQIGGAGTAYGYLLTSRVEVAKVAAVPEPASWAMLIGGFALVGASMRRQHRVRASFI